jgi:hypothetical protein
MTERSPSAADASKLRRLYFEHLLKGDGAAALHLKKEMLAKVEFLYRYRSFSRYGLEELITGQTYMARPEQLNDPYECKFLTDAGRYRTVMRSAAVANLYLEKQVHCAALCEDPRLVLMWAHYANRPHGCCLEFRTDELMLSDQCAPGIHPVIYDDQLYDANEPLQGAPERLGAVLLRMACHKLRPWEYEREWRLVSLQLKEPQNAEWPGIPMERWAPNFRIEDQSQAVGYPDGGDRFIDLPAPSRIILLGDKLDPRVKRLLHGIGRLSVVPLALARQTPDAGTENQLEIQNL